MQTLVLEIASTFADDAMAFVKGAGRLVLHAITSPIASLDRSIAAAGDLQDQSPPSPFFLLAQRFFLNNVHL